MPDTAGWGLFLDAMLRGSGGGDPEDGAAAAAAAAAAAMMPPVHPPARAAAAAAVSPWDQVAATATAVTQSADGARVSNGTTNINNYLCDDFSFDHEWTTGGGARFGYLFPGSVILGVDCVDLPGGSAAHAHPVRAMVWRCKLTLLNPS